MFLHLYKGRLGYFSQNTTRQPKAFAPKGAKPFYKLKASELGGRLQASAAGKQNSWKNLAFDF